MTAQSPPQPDAGHVGDQSATPGGRTGLSTVAPELANVPTDTARRRTIFAVVSVALLMSSIDQTIVATALPAIRDDLNTTINWAGWTITVYSLGRVLMLPLAGRLSDQYGRRTIFLWSIALFTLASLACGLANDIYLLVVLRAIQAIGGAAFMPSATGIVVDHFGDARDRAVGLFTSIIPIGAIIGPIVGGVFVAYWSWRGIFLVNVPIGLALLFAGRKYIPDVTTTTASRERLDWKGMLLIGTGLTAGMLGIAYLGSDGTRIWSVEFMVPEAIAALALGLFLHHTNRHANPFIARNLLTGRGFAIMNLLNFLFGATALGFGALVPLYAIERYHISSLDSGTLLSFRAIGMIAVGTIAAMSLRRSGYRLPIVAGFLVTAVGLFGIAASPPALSPYAWLSLAAGLTGIGMGLTNPAANNASLQLAPSQAAAIAGLRGTFRQAGSITAISITTAILARSADPGLAQAHVFAVFGLILLLAMPLTIFVPEHRGTW